MIEANDIVEAIKKRLFQEYGKKIYYYKDYIPENLKRPCFIIINVKSKPTPLNYSFRQMDREIDVIFRGETDEYHKEDRIDIAKVSDEVIAYLTDEVIAVADRLLLLDAEAVFTQEENERVIRVFADYTEEIEHKEKEYKNMENVIINRKD